MLDSLPIHRLTAGLSAEDREGGLQMVGIDRLKNIINNNSLRECRDHSRVLFVQHPAKNGQTRTILRRSFVACAGLFGNSERATEGGIPRSSRFRWFAKSLALSGSVRKARNG